MSLQKNDTGGIIEVNAGDTARINEADRKDFLGCFIVLVASAFGFVFRSLSNGRLGCAIQFK